MQSSMAREKSFPFEFDDVRQAAAGRWDSIYNALAPTLRHAVDKAPRGVECPTHESSSKRPNGFRFHKTFRENGRGGCNTCGWPGDGFAVLAQFNGWSIKQAFEEVARHLGLFDPNRPVQVVAPRLVIKEAKPPTPNEFYRRLLNDTWRGSFSIAASESALLRQYLDYRKVLPQALPSELRFHPRLPMFAERDDGPSKKIGQPPAMVARILDPNGKPVTLHRTYLTMSGKKSPVEDAKMMLPAVIEGTIGGGAVRLYPEGTSLGLAEGIETALAVFCATGMPVWACLNTAMLGSVVIPDSVQDIVIWADSDTNGAGTIAANRLMERLAKQGRTARVFYPTDADPEAKTDIDWADLYFAYGAGVFPKL